MGPASRVEGIVVVVRGGGDNLLKSQRLKAFCAFGLKALKPSNQAVDSALHCW